MTSQLEGQASERRRSPSGQRGYNTNLASEFDVLSMLYRLGLDANLTLGNKKSVDIAVVLGPGRTVTLDVKAVAGKTDWLMGGSSSRRPLADHFVVLVTYEGRFGDAKQVPPVLDLPARRDRTAGQDGGSRGEDALPLTEVGAHQLRGSGRELERLGATRLAALVAAEGNAVMTGVWRNDQGLSVTTGSANRSVNAHDAWVMPCSEE